MQTILILAAASWLAACSGVISVADADDGADAEDAGGDSADGVDAGDSGDSGDGGDPGDYADADGASTSDYTESHYVTQNGAGSRTGRSPNDAWSVADFNDPANWSSGKSVDGAIGPGDVVYFSGTIASTLSVQGSGAAGAPLTLDGWEGGDCDPNNRLCSDSALIDHGGNSAKGILISSVHHLIIQDFRIHGVQTGIYGIATSPGTTSSHIVIRRVHLEKCAQKGVTLTTNNLENRHEHLTIEDSVVVDTAEGVGDSACASILLASVDDVVIARNHIYNRPAFTPVRDGTDGIVTLYCNRMLIERNRIHRHGEDGIDFKSNGAGFDRAFGGVIIRYNVIYDTLQSGITLQHESGANAYVYGNLIYGIEGQGIQWYPILVQRGFEDMSFWANVILDSDSSGIAIYNQDANRPVDNAAIYNNTIVGNRIRNDNYGHGGVALLDRNRGTYIVMNNIFVDNAINDSDRGQLITRAGVGDYTTEDYNIYYLSNESDSPRIYWNAASSSDYFNLSDPVSATSYHSQTGQGAHSRVVNPRFVDLSGRNLRLREDSPAIGAGLRIAANPSWWDVPTIQGVDYAAEVSLNKVVSPQTDWEATIPEVIMVEQGEKADVGAYAYKPGG